MQIARAGIIRATIAFIYVVSGLPDNGIARCDNTESNFGATTMHIRREMQTYVQDF